MKITIITIYNFQSHINFLQLMALRDQQQPSLSGFSIHRCHFSTQSRHLEKSKLEIFWTDASLVLKQAIHINEFHSQDVEVMAGQIKRVSLYILTLFCVLKLKLDLNLSFSQTDNQPLFRICVFWLKILLNVLPAFDVCICRNSSSSST